MSPFVWPAAVAALGLLAVIAAVITAGHDHKEEGK